MGGVVLGDDEQPGGVAVQPVHDPGPAAVLAPARDAGERLRQRAGLVPARRVHHDAGGLVDHEQVVVLVGHGVGRVGALHARRLGRLVDGDVLTGAHAMALGHRDAVDEHVAVLDQALRPRARPERAGEDRVEALPLVLRRRVQVHRGGPGALPIRRAARRRRT